MKRLFVGVLALTIAASSASAATVVNEAAAGSGAFPSGGDYADAFGATRNDGALRNNLGNIRLGETQILGDLRMSRGDLADWFYFTLPTGLEITSVNLASRTEIGPDTPTLQVLVRDSTGAIVESSAIFSAGGTETLDNVFRSLAAGLYNVGLLYQSGEQRDVKYTLTANAAAIAPAPVPLPAALPLLLAGLGGLSLLRRRQRA
jgi:hypothetical protein